MFKRLKFGPWQLGLSLCVLAAPLPACAADHLVHIGLNNQLQFTDAQSGTNVTVVRPGDTVTWEWDYVGIDHSTTSGTCPQNNCIPDGIWDSGLRLNPPPPPAFTRQFNTLGTFPYFCRIHGPIGMRGKVVVLSGPDYELDFDNNSVIFLPPLVPFMETVAGQPANFTGDVISFLGYGNLINLSCSNGSPRNPDNCPPQSVSPDPSGAPANFNFSVGDSQGGTFIFNITGVGTDATKATHSQEVELQVMGFELTDPIPSTVTVIPGDAVPMQDFQVSSLGGLDGFVALSCSLPASWPPSAGCAFTQNGFLDSQIFLGPNSSADVRVAINPGSAAPGIYSVQVTGSASVFTGSVFVNLTHSQTVTVNVIPADHLSLQVPSGTQVTSGTPFNLFVTAADGSGNPVTSYGQTIHFTSSDASIAAALPADYTFVPTDNGKHSFPVTLTNVEPVKIAVTDTSIFHVSGISPLILVKPSTVDGTVTITSSRTGTSVPHFHDTSVTFTATVTLDSGSPTGTVTFFDGADPLGQPATLGAPTGQSAEATLVVPELAIGDHTITAVYQPSAGTGAVGSMSQSRSPAPRCDPTRCP